MEVQVQLNLWWAAISFSLSLPFPCPSVHPYSPSLKFSNLVSDFSQFRHSIFKNSQSLWIGIWYLSRWCPLGIKLHPEPWLNVYL